jgi:hypothetical protein
MSANARTASAVVNRLMPKAQEAWNSLVDTNKIRPSWSADVVDQLSACFGPRVSQAFAQSEVQLPSTKVKKLAPGESTPVAV